MFTSPESAFQTNAHHAPAVESEMLAFPSPTVTTMSPTPSYTPVAEEAFRSYASERDLHENPLKKFLFTRAPAMSAPAHPPSVTSGTTAAYTELPIMFLPTDSVSTEDMSVVTEHGSDSDKIDSNSTANALAWIPLAAEPSVDQLINITRRPDNANLTNISNLSFTIEHANSTMTTMATMFGVRDEEKQEADAAMPPTPSPYTAATGKFSNCVESVT